MENGIVTKLPKKKYGKKYVVDWSKVFGQTIQISHKDKIYDIYVIGRNKNKKYINIIYKNSNPFKIESTRLLNGCIGNLVGTKTNKYRYNVGEIIEIKSGKIKILEQKRIIRKDGYTVKGYKYQCLNDFYINEVSESTLITKKGCPICSNKKVVKGINDVATTHPHLIKYFVNIENAYKYSYGSMKKIKTICPECGDIREDLTIKQLSKNNYVCFQCGNTIPYTERFVYSFLKQITKRDDIVTQYHPKWKELGLKRYDFYIKSRQCVIETHGRQHYDNNCFEGINKISLEEEQKNDEIKERLAKQNGIDYYIVIDCRESKKEFIKNNILDSKLTELFDLNNVDWDKVQENSMKNITKQICVLWNNKKTMKEIKKEFGISNVCALYHLKRGTHIGWCNYSKEESKRRSLEKQHKEYKNPIVGINIKTLNILCMDKIVDCEQYGMTPSLVSMAINNRIRYHKGYVWIKSEDYIDTEDFKNNLIKTKLGNKKKKYIGIKGTNKYTGEVIFFENFEECKVKGFLKSGISQSCIGKIEYYKNYKWKYII